jgi:hypothetical protein
LLTADQKRTRMKISEQCLERFNKNNSFLLRFITMDGTCIHYYTPESKQQSKLDRSRLFSAKEDKVGSISRKVMASVFWVAEGILFIEYLEKKGKIITGEYYSNLLTRLDEKIRNKRSGLQKKKSSFIRTMHQPTKVFW